LALDPRRRRLWSDTVHVLSSHEEGTGRGLGAALAPLGALLEFYATCTYGLDTSQQDALRLSFIETIGLDRNAASAAFSDALTVGGSHPGVYHARHVEPWNRNTVMTGADLLARWPFASPPALARLAFPRLGLVVNHQLRVLVCDGPAMLGWIGGYRERPYDTSDVGALRSLVPALRTRMLLDEMIGDARSLLDLALEELPDAAFVVRASGSVAYANAAGRAAMDKDRRALRQELAGAVLRRRRDPTLRAIPITCGGRPGHWLVLRRDDSAATRAERAGARWGLTPRQRQVLALLAEGSSTARIALELRVSERTVESHVSAIFERARVSSRAALIAMVLAGHP
jgi:DNA-binding CsgD family transcriptional regulator